MPKHFLLVLFMLPLTLNAQKFINQPNFEHTTAPDVILEKIELAEDFSVFYFSFTMPDDFIYGGWVAIKKQMFLRDVATNDRYFLQRVTNVPILPEKYYFSGPGDRIEFEVYFDPVDAKKTTVVDLIEDPNGGLNFYNISLIEGKKADSSMKLSSRAEKERHKISKSITAKSTKQALVKPTKQATAKPAKQTITEPTKQAIAKPTKQTLAEPTKQILAEPTKQTITEPTNQNIVEPITESTNEEIAKPTKQEIAEPSNQEIIEPAKEITVKPNNEVLVTEPSSEETTVPIMKSQVPLEMQRQLQESFLQYQKNSNPQ